MFGKTNRPTLEFNTRKRGLLEREAGIDLAVVILTVLICLFGVLMVYSASYYMSINEYGHPNHYAIRQIVFLAAGLVAMFALSQIDYHLWIGFGGVIYLIGLGLLVLVLVVGSTANGGQRWIQIGPVTIMPGEMAKAAIILAVSRFLAKDPDRADDWTKGILPIIAVTGVYLALIMLQPNMSTAFTIVFIVGAMLFVAGTKIWKLLILVGLGGGAGLAYIFLDSTGYRLERVQSMLDPFQDALGSGFQVVQSLLALGTGGLTGLGLGNSIQKNLYLPFAHNDFILSIIGEELGYVGILALMLAYILLIWAGLRVAMNAKDYAGMMLASGVVIMIAVQVLMNIAVVTSLMPPTGVVLPFVSYGGTAELVYLSMVGMLLNVSKR